MKEAVLERKVVAYCKVRGVLCYKFSSPSRRGVPDRILLRDGKVLFLELKATGAKPTALQVREAARLNAAGFSTCCTDRFADATAIIDSVFPPAK